MRAIFAVFLLAAGCFGQSVTGVPNSSAAASSASGGTPGGSPTQVQYNNAGAFGGISGATTNGTIVTLTTPQITTSATLTNSGIGVVQTDGYIATNTTAAAAGAQQASPCVRLTGQGWAVTGSSSQPVDWCVATIPVQGAGSAPTSNLIFYSRINGGAWTAAFTLSNTGALTIPGLVSFSSNLIVTQGVTSSRALIQAFSATGAGGGFTVDTANPTGGFCWSGSVQFTEDTCFSRNASGVVEINGGTKGTITGDLKLRHYLAAGTAPTIASGFGTTPSIAGGDAAGRVTVGTGGVATTGAITFGTAYATAPSCIANNETSVALVQATATTSTLTLTASAAFTAASTLTWQCTGF